MKHSMVLTGVALAALTVAAAHVETPKAVKCQEKAEIRWTRPICVEPGRYIGWPSVCRLRSGDILAVFSGDRAEHVCPFGKVQMVRSTDEGETWSDPVTIADGPIDDRDAGIVQMPDGEIVVTYFTSVAYYLRGLYKEGWKDSNMKELGYFRVSSRDNGRTWSAPERMLGGVSQSPHGPKLLKDGSLIIMGRTFEGEKIGAKGKSRTIISVWKSTDAGRNWTCLCPSVPDMDGENAKPAMFHEPDIVELADGTLLGQVRYHGGDHALRQTVSKDGGKTWSPMRKTELIGYPSHLLNLRDGRLVSVYSRRLASAGLGEYAAISADGGKTWDVKNEICLLPGVRPTRDFGYPATCELKNGDLLTVYYQPKALGEKPCLIATKWRLRDLAKTDKVRIEQYRNSYWMRSATEPGVPTLAQKLDKEFHGRATDLVRIDANNAVGPETHEWKGLAWRNERVNAQFVVWSGQEVQNLRVVKEDLRSEQGGVIPASAIKARFLLNVLGSPAEGSVESGHRLYGDILDGDVHPLLPANAFRTLWLTIRTPKDIPAGIYRGAATIRGNGGKAVRFTLALEVVDRTVSDPKDWPFHVSFWQHPLSAARCHKVRPFSPEHYRLLEPLFREYAAAGEREVYAPIRESPWIENGEYRSLILHTRKADGSMVHDYSVFDEYIAFGLGTGVGPYILCDSTVHRKRNGVYYVDEPSGDLVWKAFPVKSEECESFCRDFLQDFRRHLREKGWLDRTCIEIDELKLEDAAPAIEYIRKYAPEIKIKMSCDKPPTKFLALKPDFFSQGLRTPTERMFPPDFWTTMAERKRQNLRTLFYVCNLPGTPNRWVRSNYDESLWLGFFAYARGFDGFGSWAAFCWGRDPEWDASSGRYDAGECHLLYPRGRTSPHWEMLCDAFENCEKLRLIKESGAMTPELERALAAISFDCVVSQYESDENFKIGRDRITAEVTPIMQALDAASR